MKVDQSLSGFAPIHIVLETRLEAEMFWALLRGDEDYDDANMKQFRETVSDWFSNQAQL